LLGWVWKRWLTPIWAVFLCVVSPGPGLDPGQRAAGRVYGSLAVSAATLAGSASAAHVSQRGAECPDPTILVERSVGPAVTLMCTGYGFPTRSAASLGRLSDAIPHAAFAATGWPAWASGQFWAPDLERVGSRYLLYYSARRRGDWRNCIGVAVSDRPDGGFRDLGAPLIGTEADGTIDPALLSFGGRLFLFYKHEGSSAGAASVIVGRRLSADGLRLVGPKVELLRSRADGWEHGVVEAPAPFHVGDTTYLLYSGGLFYAPGYAEGEAARTGDPLGPYRRVSAAPVLYAATGRWVGTAGGSIVSDGNQLLLAYAAFRPNERSLRRMLFIRQLRLQDGILRPFGPARQISLRRR
jgi:arabinan endo-1,5-alpha-L-arabinosidase